MKKDKNKEMEKPNNKEAEISSESKPTKEEELKNKLLRAMADFENYKKLMAQEKQQFAKFANQNLISDLLPVLDGFGRAIEAAQGNPELIKGLSLVKKQFEDVFNKYGVQEVVALGQAYDANLHHAMAQEEHDGPEGIILKEMQKGYTLHGRLIRPAMVIVSKKKEEK